MSEGDREKERGARPSSSIAHTYSIHFSITPLPPCKWQLSVSRWGEKRPINTTAQKAQALFNPRRVVLLHPHTPTHIYTHTVHSWARERRVDAKRRWARRMVIQEKEFLICCTKAEAKMKSLIMPWLLAGVGSNSRQHASWVNQALHINLPCVVTQFLSFTSNFWSPTEKIYTAVTDRRVSLCNYVTLWSTLEDVLIGTDRITLAVISVRGRKNNNARLTRRTNAPLTICISTGLWLLSLHMEKHPDIPSASLP